MKRFNFGCIIKVLILAVLIVVILFVYLSCSGSSLLGCQRIDKSLPDISRAPFTISTRTGILYAKEASQNSDGSVVLTKWYEKVYDKWVFHEGPDTIPRVLKPVVKRR
jgi:hypothetical protein